MFCSNAAGASSAFIARQPLIMNQILPKPAVDCGTETIFLNMHNDSKGRIALDALGIDKYTLVSPDLYDEAEKITIDVASEVSLP